MDMGGVEITRRNQILFVSPTENRDDPGTGEVRGEREQ